VRAPGGTALTNAILQFEQNLGTADSALHNFDNIFGLPCYFSLNQSLKKRAACNAFQRLRSKGLISGLNVVVSLRCAALFAYT